MLSTLILRYNIFQIAAVAQTIFHNVLDSIVIVGQSSKDPKKFATAITDELLHNVGTMTESLAALKHRIGEGLYDDKESEGNNV